MYQFAITTILFLLQCIFSASGKTIYGVFRSDLAREKSGQYITSFFYQGRCQILFKITYFTSYYSLNEGLIPVATDWITVLMNLAFKIHVNGKSFFGTSRRWLVKNILLIEWVCVCSVQILSVLCSGEWTGGVQARECPYSSPERGKVADVPRCAGFWQPQLLGSSLPCTDVQWVAPLHYIGNDYWSLLGCDCIYSKR